MVSLLISLELALAQMLILHHLAVTSFLLLVLVLIVALALAPVPAPVWLAQVTVVAAALILVLAPIGSVLALPRA